MNQCETEDNYPPVFRIETQGDIAVITILDAEDLSAESYYSSEVYAQMGDECTACAGVDANKVKRLLAELMEELHKGVQETEL